MSEPDYPYKCGKCGEDAWVEVWDEYLCRACYEHMRGKGDDEDIWQ